MDKLNKTLTRIPIRPLKIVTSILGLFLSVFMLARYIPASWLNHLPATGGDTGSHFWPVKVLHDYGITHLTARPWNPGNNGGEGLLVHYFPLPFILMALASFIIPAGLAFNIGTLLPVLTLPLSVWFSLRKMRSPSIACFLGAIFSSLVILNEGHSMWGGNTLSTLAGQFAHMYALNFLMLAIGFLWSEMRTQQIPWKSGLLFSAVALCHGYIYFSVPIIILIVVVMAPGASLKHKLILGLLSGGISGLLAAWFIGPMILNNSWVTPHSFSWHFQDWVKEVVPKILEPLIIFFTIATLWISFVGIHRKSYKAFKIAMFWFLAGIVYLIFFFVFRWLKLVDVRALPQTQIFWGISFASLTAACFCSLPKKLSYFLTLLLGGFLTYWAHSQVVKFPVWLEWNYSGWQTKNNYNNLQILSDKLRGTLSDPRVAFEHHLKNNQVGTERVFEMLPYFANRATNESLYLQSTILAPMIYSFTSEISESASCPFHDWPCARFNLQNSKPHMELLGVNELILSSDIAVNAATQSAFLKQTLAVGPWKLFENINLVSMADTFPSRPIPIQRDNWKAKFWDWYKTYYPGKSFLILEDQFNEKFSQINWLPSTQCHPQTRVDFSGISLTTDCPGVPHYLKYAYHPSFTSSGGELIFLVSPGFIGIIPESRETKLLFGSTYTWAFFRLVSFLSCLVVLFLVVKKVSPFPEVAFLNSLLSSFETAPKALSKKQSPQKKHSKEHNRLPFYILSFCFASIYVFVSLKTDSFLFWQWRQLNFKDFDIVNASQEYGVLHKNENLEGNPLIIQGERYFSGLTTHAFSEVQIRLKNADRFFSGACGYPDNAFGAELKCEIFSGSQLLYSSRPLGNVNRIERFQIPLNGTTEIRLIFRSLKSDITAAHGAWVNLKTAD